MNQSRPTTQFATGSARRASGLNGRLFVLLGALVLAVPAVPSGEFSELGAAKERVEDAAIAARGDHLHRCDHHRRREASSHPASFQAVHGSFAQAQRGPTSPQAAAPGHRLPNGLMAPMTC